MILSVLKRLSWLRRRYNVERGPAFLTFIATALVFIWFRKGLMMGAGEAGILLYNSARSFSAVRYAWTQGSLGCPVVFTACCAPFYFFVNSLEQAKIPVVVCQAFTFWLILAVSGLSVYHLAFTTTGEHRQLTAVLAGLFYMVNPFVMVNVWNRFQLTFMFFYALIPLALFLYVNGLQLHRAVYAFYVNIACLAFAYAFASVPLIGTFWIVLSSYFIFHILTNLRNKPEVLYTIRFFVLTLFLWLLLNSWWLLLFTSTAGPRFQSYLPSENISIMKSISEELGRILSLICLSHRQFFEGTATAVWSPFYSSTAFNIALLIIPLLVFSSLLYKPKCKLTVYFVFLSVLGLFLAKGSAPPLGEIFLWIFTHFPAFQVFRSPFEKFGVIIALGYAVPFGVGLSSLYYSIPRAIKKHVHISLAYDHGKPVARALILLICFLTYGLSWPMWTGMVFTSASIPNNNPEIGCYVSVPTYYNEANLWLSSQEEEFRLLVLPIDGVGITYNWTYGYCGAELSNQLFDRPCISLPTTIPYNDDIIKRLERESNNTTEFWKVMALLNAKYIVVRSDINYDVDYVRESYRSHEEMRRIIHMDAKHIKYVKTFGKLDFYKIDEGCFLDRIYATNQFIFSKDIDDMLFNVIKNDSFTPGETVIFLLSQSDINNITLLESLRSGNLYRPDITFEKVNPTKYIVHVASATDPFFLVFSETYNPLWRAYINGEQIPDKYHFIANGYANAWYINKMGSFDIVLEFWPQRLSYLGAIISTTTFIACLAYISKDWFIKLRRKVKKLNAMTIATV